MEELEKEEFNNEEEIDEDNSLEHKLHAVPVEELRIDGQLIKSIRFRSPFSVIVIIIAGIAILFTRRLAGYILGGFCILLAVVVWRLVKDYKTIDIYPDYLIVYSDEENKKAARISFDEIEEWTTKNNTGGNDAVMLKLKNGVTIYKDTFELGKFYNEMMKHIPEKESRMIQLEKNKNRQYYLKNPFKKWFKK